MKLSYHPETDSLYIQLSERKSAESREVSEGVDLDYDATEEDVRAVIALAAASAEEDLPVPGIPHVA